MDIRAIFRIIRANHYGTEVQVQYADEMFIPEMESTPQKTEMIFVEINQAVLIYMEFPQIQNGYKVQDDHQSYIFCIFLLVLH